MDWDYATIWARDDSAVTNGVISGNEFASDFFSSTNASRSAIINEFRFQTAKSIRTSTVILASFNVLAAFATAAGIVWDSYATRRRNDPQFRLRTSGFTFVSAPDTFPLALSLCVVVQGIIFAAAQSTGLTGMFTLGCTVTSQFMLPAIFIVPYIQLIFALETSFRSLCKQPFASRGRWTATGVVALLGTLLLATFLVSHFLQAPSFCFPSLYWFVQRWKDGIFVALIVIAGLLLITTAIIFARLYSCTEIDLTERIAASRLVYYLAIGIIPIALTIPFFYSLVFSDLRTAGAQPLNLSMIASVVNNLSGLTTGGLHLLLRANCLSSIGTGGKVEEDRQKLKGDIRVRARGYSYQDMDSPSYSDRRYDGTFSPRLEKEEEERVESPTGTPTYENPHPLRLNIMPPPSPMLAVPIMMPDPSPRRSRIEALKSQIRKSGYSLFPREHNGNTKSFGLLPATVYSPNPKPLTSPPTRDDDDGDIMSLAPPPQVFDGGVRHRRTSSLVSALSHATVQIGMRFSNVQEAPRIDSRYISKVHDLGCPLEREQGASKRPSPLAASNSDSEDEEDGETLVAHSPKGFFPDEKRLPPSGEEPLTLTAAVYSPSSSTAPSTRVTSPRGVGFSSPPLKRSNSREARPRCYKDDCDCDGIHRGEWI